MEFVSLHPFDATLANAYVEALMGTRAPDPAWASWWTDDLLDAVTDMAAGRESAANRLTVAMAMAMAVEHPVFLQEGFGLTAWEARVDRGVGMLMRPPARIFVDAGMSRGVVDIMPIRLDLHGGIMGGAYVPDRLIGQLDALLDERLERMAKRLKDAEYDPFPMLGLMREAVTYANERGLGLYEAINVATPDMRVVRAPDRKRMDPLLRERIEKAITPEKKPGMLGRLFGRKKPDEGR